MDETRFDALTRALSGHPTRRNTLRLLAGGVLAGLLSRHAAVPVRAAQRPDRDGDGLFDDDEVEVYFTNPDLFDTDGDGAGDGLEVYNRDNGLGDPDDPLTPDGGGAPPAPAGGECVPGQCIADAGEPTGALFNTCLSQGLTDCGGYCADTLSDPNNCGFCGNFCSLVAGLVCQGGVCTSTTGPCPAGLTDCGGGYCTNVGNDIYNCGACGFRCGDGHFCCDGACKDLSSDKYNCGYCGNWCPGGLADPLEDLCQNYQCT